jgi:hypothetical protein
VSVQLAIHAFEALINQRPLSVAETRSRCSVSYLRGESRRLVSARPRAGISGRLQSSV